MSGSGTEIRRDQLKRDTRRSVLLSTKVYLALLSFGFKHPGTQQIGVGVEAKSKKGTKATLGRQEASGRDI